MADSRDVILYAVRSPSGDTTLVEGPEFDTIVYTPTERGLHLVRARRKRDGAVADTSFFVNVVPTIDIGVSTDPDNPDHATVSSMLTADGRPITYPVIIDWGDGSLDSVVERAADLPVSHEYSPGSNQRVLTAVDRAGLSGTAAVMGGGGGLPGPEGPQGPPGEQGIPGVDGVPGTQWFEGHGAPADPYPGARDGDYFLDVDTGDVYVLTGTLASYTMGGRAVQGIGSMIPNPYKSMVPGK